LPDNSRYNRGDVRSLAKSWTPRILLLALAGSGLSLAATNPGVHDLPSPLDSGTVSGWVLADLNGDQSADLATASSGQHDAYGYAQEVRIKLGAFQQTTFHFQSRGATVELSTRDVDGDRDGDLVVFEPFSSQPIGVWLNDGAGSFHEGRLADFRKLWSDQPGSTWRVKFPRLASLAVSEERTQSVTSAAVMAAPEPVFIPRTRQNDAALREARQSDFRPRAPPRNS
jgi:hypothetical protein